MLKDKKVLILGVANKSSIAWGITEALKNSGAKIALTYLNESIEKRVRPLAEEIGCQNVYQCDVQSDQNIQDMYNQIKSDWGGLDGVVHSVAFANKKNTRLRSWVACAYCSLTSRVLIFFTINIAHIQVMSD